MHEEGGWRMEHGAWRFIFSNMVNMSEIPGITIIFLVKKDKIS
jgi:hypothetical protein